MGHKKFRWLRWLLSLLILLILLVAFLPRILSTGVVRGVALNKVNATQPGNVAIDAWSLSWRGPLTVEGVAFDPGPGGPSVSVQSVNVEKGLLGLARNWRRFGTVRVESPRVVLPQGPEPAEEPAAPDAEAPGTSEPPDTAPREAGPAEPPVSFRMPGLFGTLEVVGAKVQQSMGEGEVETLIDDAQVTVTLNGNREPIEVVLAVKTPGSSGAVELDLEVGPLGDGEIDPMAVPLQMTCALTDLDLHALFRTAGAWAEVPDADGLLRGRISVQGAAASRLKVQGTLNVPALKLAGGPLGTDTPDFGQVVVNINASLSPEGVSISNALLRCRQAQINAGGTAMKQGDGNLTVQGTVDLPALTTALPATLRLQPGVSIREGTVSLNGYAARLGTELKVGGKVNLPVLAGEAQGRSLRWDAPVELVADATVAGDTLQQVDLAVTAPFLAATAKGNLDAFALTASSDLAAAIREVGQLVDVGEWQVGGRLTVSGDIKRAEEASRIVDLKVAFTEGEVRQGDSLLMPKSDASLAFVGQIGEPGGGGPLAIRGGTLDWATYVSRGQAGWREIVVQSADGEAPPDWSVSGLRVKAVADLGAVSDLLPVEDGGAPPVGLAGQVTVAVAADASAERIDLESLDLAATSLAVTQGGKTLREPSLTLKTRGAIKLDGPEANLGSTGIALSAGTVSLTNVTARLAAGALRGAEVHGGAELDLAKLLAVLGPFVELPEATAVSGASKVAFTAEVAEDARLAVQAAVQLTGLTVTREKEALVDNETLTADVRVARDGRTGALELGRVNLDSSPLTLTAKGGMARTEEGGEVVESAVDLSGDLGIDFPTVSEYIKAFAGIELVMEGKDQRPFSFSSRWRPADGQTMMAHADLEAGLELDRLQGFGLDIEALALPVRIRQGVTDFTLGAVVNQGQLRVNPLIDFTADPVDVILQDPTNLLHDVEVTEDLANDLLALIHPLFKNATGISGKMDMGMDSFTWPLDAARRDEAVFSGTVDFRDLAMETTGWLDRILTAAKVKERNLDIGNRDFQFSCRDGLIRVSDMKIEIDDYLVIIGGTMDLDQNIDYVVQVPVTEELVGSDAYAYLEDTTVRIPVRGPASNPDVGLHVLQEATADLVKQAAKNAVKKTIEKEAGKLIESLFQ